MMTWRHSQILGTIPFLIAVCLIAFPAQAKYSGGSGTAADPYQIATAADLIALGETPGDYDKHFLLTADIDLDPNLPGRKVFDKAVIGPDEWPLPDTLFTGVFDGNGHTISHLTIKGGGYLGLFGELRMGAEVRDLGIADVNITASNDYTGALVGTNGGTLTGCYSTGVVSGREDVGGLVGDNWGPVAQCYSACAVSGGNGVGGLMGENSNGTVSNCYSTSVVRGTGQDGGLMGYNRGTVIHCFWDTQTSGQATSAGGTGKSTAEMQTASTFLDAGWDFVNETANGSDDIWKISEGLGYPRLWWEWAGKYGGGTGEPNDPFLIFTAEQMNAIGAEPNDWSKHFKVMTDIDLSGFDGKDGRPAFNIIAPDADPNRDYYQGTGFTGVFDGGRHKLSHLTIRGGSFLGLLGELAAGAAVTNVWIEDVNVTGSGDYIAALAANSRGAITHCYSTGVVNATGKAEDHAYLVGGLVGENFGDVTFCHSTATVVGGVYVGGFVGENWGSVTRCYSAGAVRGGGSVGGFVGENLGAVTRCENWGPVTGDSYVGGLIGENYSGRVANCYSTGTVSGGWYAGGLVGQNGGASDEAKAAVVTRCYSAGPVKGQGYFGGLVGWNLAAVTGCFWDTQTSGQAASAAGTAKTTAQMLTASTFLNAGWDFVGEAANGTEDIWSINEGKDYPRLRRETAADPNATAEQ
jgi:hypothetical protein